jgi:DNA-binding NarL/FixJ family response regulator
MPEPARILFGGNLSPKWLSVEHQLCARVSVAVTRLSGSPEETLAYCQRLVPCVLVVDEGFTSKVRAEEFSEAADFGRSIRVVVEVDDRNLGKAESLIRMGCVGVLSKDASPATALRALEVILAGELWLDRKTVGQIVQNVLHDMKCRLTFRETEILGLLAEGLKNQQIAERLFISPQTVRWHLRSLYSKLGTHDRFCAVHRASWPNGSRTSLRAMGSRSA